MPWIENLKEGESAFQNTEEERIPHQIKTGDKYARWYWDREGPCVHTRNDILSSQNTVHPSENRVFSIRELMLMMSIPENFQWTSQSTEKLNKMSVLEKKMHLNLGVSPSGRAFRSNLLLVPHTRISTAIPNALKQVA